MIVENARTVKVVRGVAILLVLTGALALAGGPSPAAAAGCGRTYIVPQETGYALVVYNLRTRYASCATARRVARNVVNGRRPPAGWSCVRRSSRPIAVCRRGQARVIWDNVESAG